MPKENNPISQNDHLGQVASLLKEAPEGKKQDVLSKVLEDRLLEDIVKKSDLGQVASFLKEVPKDQKQGVLKKVLEGGSLNKCIEKSHLGGITSFLKEVPEDKKQNVLDQVLGGGLFDDLVKKSHLGGIASFLTEVPWNKKQEVLDKVLEHKSLNEFINNHNENNLRNFNNDTLKDIIEGLKIIKLTLPNKSPEEQKESLQPQGFRLYRGFIDDNKEEETLRRTFSAPSLSSSGGEELINNTARDTQIKSLHSIISEVERILHGKEGSPSTTPIATSADLARAASIDFQDTHR